jgi:lysophospholipid acyltransferase (LPLAT)-like uncharacterized protein
MIRRTLKRLMGRPGFRSALGRIVAGYISFVKMTSRIEIHGQAHADQYWDKGQPFILSFWHGRLMMMPLVWRQGVAIDMLISNHRDGDLIARTISHFKLDTIRGSSAKTGREDKGGMAALRAIVRALGAGRCVGITPDGPRGPRMRASEGVVAIARLAGVPILPAVSATSRRVKLGSWDHFLVALPFGRIVLMWGEPIIVTRDCDLAAKRLEVESAMNLLAEQADRAVGQLPVLPAPVALPALAPDMILPGVDAGRGL